MRSLHPALCQPKQPKYLKSLSPVKYAKRGLFSVATTRLQKGSNMQAQENWLHGENTTTVPVSVRLPAGDAYKLYMYAEQMNTSPGKLLARLSDDIWPAFTGEDDTVTLRASKVYKRMRNVNLLKSVNAEALKDRVVKRTEPGGKIGRPPKLRSVP
jgi:hypothetical protein